MVRITPMDAKANSSRSYTCSRPTEVGLDSEDKPPEEATSFRHLLCTNDDPDSCAICSRVFEGKPWLASCCGSYHCDTCNEQSSYLRYDERSVELCALCGKKAPMTARDKFRMLLSAARKGQAWAQHAVAQSFEEGDGVEQSHSEALCWHKKAAEQGHPHAFVDLGFKYENGEGCAANPSEAERYYRMAADLSQALHKDEKFRGVNNLSLLSGVDNLALLMSKQGRGEEARDLLLPFAAEGNAELQWSLGDIYVHNFSNYEETAKWLRSAAIQGHSKAAQSLVSSYMHLGRHALAKFWMNIVMKIGIGVIEGELVPNMQVLRRNEEHCGACDEKLGTPKQNMCKQCRTYCYCNRLCQIRHWKRGGHREDCKEVGELKKEEEEMLELFKNEPDDWFGTR